MIKHALAERMNALMGESAFQVLAEANKLEAQGKSVIHFEIGEPDFPTSRHVVEAGKKALEAGQTRYCNAQGLPSLREAIVEHVRTFKGLSTNPAEVVVAPGGKPIIFFTLCALVNPGDEVIYPDPGFPTYESVIRYAGGIPVPVVLKEENDFRMQVEELKASITQRTKLLILNSPSNPTGSLLTRNDLGEIATAVVKAGIFVLSDEIYSRIVYKDVVQSIATFPGMKERTVVLDGFSKTYCMTGWRLGYGIMHEELCRPHDTDTHKQLLLHAALRSVSGHCRPAGAAGLGGGDGSGVRASSRRDCERLERHAGVSPAGSLPAHFTHTPISREPGGQAERWPTTS